MTHYHIFVLRKFGKRLLPSLSAFPSSSQDLAYPSASFQIQKFLSAAFRISEWSECANTLRSRTSLGMIRYALRTFFGDIAEKGSFKDILPTTVRHELQAWVRAGTLAA